MKFFRDEIKIEWTSNDAGYWENSEPTSNCTLRHVLAVWKVSLQNPSIAHWLHMTDNFPSHLFFNFCLSKPHTNSLMSSLNSRSGWKYNDTTLSFEHNQVVCYLFIHSQLDSLHVCVWVGSPAWTIYKISPNLFLSLRCVCVCVCVKKGRCREVVFFSADLYIFLEGDDCDDDLWFVLLLMMMMIKDDGWQISFFLLILDLFFDFLTDFF